MRSFDDVFNSQKAKGDLRFSWDVIHKQKKAYELEDILHNLGEGGRCNSIEGESGQGKTFTASFLMWLYERMGYLVLHNLAIFSNNPNIVHITKLSTLTKRMCQEPMLNCPKCDYFYAYDTKEKHDKGHCPRCKTKLTSRRLVIFLDEANLSASGAQGNTKKLATIKAWVNNFMRKLGGGEGACIFMIFQHESMGAPMFREGGILYGVIQKVNPSTALVNFPNVRNWNYHPFAKSTLPIPIINIPLPKLTTHSFGPSSFKVDMDAQLLDDAVADKTEGDPRPEAFRKAVIEHIDKNETTRTFDITKLSKEERLHLFKTYAYTTIEKLAILDKLIGWDTLTSFINQKSLAKIFGVSASAITQSKNELNEL